MDNNELKNKSVKDLEEMLVEKKSKLRDLRFGISGAQLKNVRDIRKLKKEVAQILTLINSKK
ncbi:MAG: 50S ribosomal protein L29 [Candidatus Magasanikbacteria bacterium RIFCSPHIGHO2_01_FULL_33_34]|uniref:Large ribosomal subunit protein uL29 n=1 Tax=Candidatus Magasanikbacteria bacterium RIFCSPHIGHO2_01_FULL_33_34 TaxID=1798671 RepID=A0A1F6LLD6_9BACT|nr:MAG: 50S ribosomal protein L29 [Candidatus Magasanikbacteria bacterium RIFCSPHIGHO2_01_FULL_33_34]OGH65992.1 MAG: 50S ribosomal protein L29 [Candidatus Magasanikbacteria bacterium RIFCSPHIGHO2_02_FULL_33_17]OGH76387.1 MAG: 50S ribosomal protein L29 [Candidatus Magasanikbacteria bacterium RIFCSPLOWO2_01_FULL_33_34]OGH81493.1 MAG: 50S ribosomal protein L29 [Candidatus Magasanikbacteria bacterium RIFCSPLOWO2_12_FULL_34_7]